MKAKVKRRALSRTEVFCAIFFFVFSVFMAASFGCGGVGSDGTGAGSAEGGNNGRAGGSGGGSGSGGAGGGSGGGASARGLLKLRPLASPTGDFTIGVPDGWDFATDLTTRVRLVDNPISVSPAGKDEPRAFVSGMIPITMLKALELTPRLGDPDFLRKFLRAQVDAGVKWSAMDSAGVILRFLAAARIQAQITSQIRVSDAEAELLVRVSYEGKQMEERWVVSLAYNLNPALSATLSLLSGHPVSYYDSFAFLSGCGADPGKLPDFDRLCSAILRSFHPTHWLSRTIAAYLDQQDQQLRMVQQSLDRSTRQQLQTQFSAIATDRRVYRTWWNSLGGTVDLTDPTGNIYNTQDGSTYWCLTSDGRILGTEDAHDPACQTPLTRVNRP